MTGQPVPPVITTPFAKNAGGSYITNPIPVASQIGIAGQDGVASWNDGIPPLGMTAINAGGVAPRGQDFNGVMFAISSHCAALQAGQGYNYNSTVSTAIGGYNKGAILARTDGNGYWISNVAANTADPDAGGANWSPVLSYGVTTKALTNVNVTLTASEWARDIIVLTGTLTGNVQLIMPAIIKQWLIVNQTTGAFSVTVKPASGSGTVVAQGGSGAPTNVWCDGTTIYPAASVAWTAITNTPTTIAGYGISVLPWANVTGRPTTVGGYGITDAITTANIAAQSVAFATNCTNAAAVAFSGISGRPTTVGGYGITDAITTGNIGSQSVAFATNCTNATTVPFTGVSGKPTTVGGYGITNAITTGGGQSIAGNLTLAGGDMYAYRSGGTTGVVYLRADGGAYIYYDGSNYQFPNGNLYLPSQGSFVAALNSPAFAGTPTAPTAAVATSNGQIATTAFVNPSQSIGANGYVKLASGLIIQWGGVFIGDAPAGSVTVVNITFPVTFSTVYQVINSYQDTNGGTGGPLVYQTGQTTSGASYFYREINPGTQSGTLRWMAFGV